MIIKEERIGTQRLILGDCLGVMPTLGRFDAVVTDPPYGIAWRRGVNHARNSKAHDGIANDGNTSARDEALRLAYSAPAIVFGSFYAPYPDRTKQVLVWQKPADSGLVGSVTGFRRDAEPVFLVGDWPVRTVEASSVLRTWRGQSGIVAETGHPHTKPVDLIRELIGFCPGQTILDPFMGSGTTLVACQRMGRAGTGIELDSDYFDIACRRVDEAARQPDLLIPETHQPPTQEAMDL